MLQHAEHGNNPLPAAVDGRGQSNPPSAVFSAQAWSAEATGDQLIALPHVLGARCRGRAGMMELGWAQGTHPLNTVHIPTVSRRSQRAHSSPSSTIKAPRCRQKRSHVKRQQRDARRFVRHTLVALLAAWPSTRCTRAIRCDVPELVNSSLSRALRIRYVLCASAWYRGGAATCRTTQCQGLVVSQPGRRACAGMISKRQTPGSIRLGLAHAPVVQ